VRERYERRAAVPSDGRYSLLNEAALQPHLERLRALAAWARRSGEPPLARRRILEVGCGDGANLLDLIRLGAEPALLSGNELLEGRLEQARRRLPAAVSLLPGDATTLELPPGGFDVVLQSTVFSSLLDDRFQEALAAAMWRWVRPGGGVLWYDFTYDNPRNPDVRGVPLRRVRALFPHGEVQARRLTLAPPLARALCRVHPALYTAANLMPWLRTHVLAWITKPPAPRA
jgi:SAM-dependent methyltransferase